MVWFDMVCLGLSWFGIVAWHGLGLDWFGLVWFGMVWHGLAWFRLDWRGLA